MLLLELYDRIYKTPIQDLREELFPGSVVPEALRRNLGMSGKNPRLKRSAIANFCLPYAAIWSSTRGCEKHAGKFLLVNRSYRTLGEVPSASDKSSFGTLWWDCPEWQKRPDDVEEFYDERTPGSWYFYPYGRLGDRPDSQYRNMLAKFSAKIPEHNVGHALNIRVAEQKIEPLVV